MTSNPSNPSKTMYITLGSHLDLFWMGTHEECLSRGVELARAAFDLMEQNPEYCYYIETTIFADYHLHKYPEDRQRMERFLREGRLEIGGCYVDRVEHIHEGESLIRHTQIGIRWLRDTFGIQPRTAIHPDLPGMSPQIPQIYAKAGILAYLRARGFGYMFDWVAPDGSHMLYANLWGYGEKSLKDFEAPLKDPSCPPALLVRGGYGDLQQPTGKVLDLVNTLRESHPDVAFRFVAPGQVLDQFPIEKMPPLCGEMPFGWGSIPAGFVHLMQLSVDLEHRLLTAERWVGIAQALGLAVEPAPVKEPEGPIRHWWFKHRLSGDVLYSQPVQPGQELNELWRYELLTQDHNYGGHHGAQSDFDKTVMKEHGLIESQRWLDGALSAISGSIRLETPAAAGPSAEPLVVYNALSWPRDEVIELDLPKSGPLQVRSATGEVLPAQATAKGLAVQVQAPALGYTTLFLTQDGAASQAGQPDPATLESRFLTAHLDLQHGLVDRLYDKEHQREVLEPGDMGLGELISYEDPGVDVRYAFTGATVSDRDGKWEVVSSEDGPVFARTVLASLFLDSRVEKEYTLYKNEPRLDLRTRLYWWGKKGEHIRQCFPFRRQGHAETNYGVPFATMRWPEMLTGEVAEQILKQGGADTDMLFADDRLHFREAIGWLDVGYDRWGATLGTRSSTFWIDGSLLQAVLLRTQFSCGDANLWCLNQGQHEWNFRIQLHEGDWRSAQAYRTGQDHLYPLAATRPAANPNGTLPPQHSFLTLSPQNVLVTALKPSDVDPDAFIVRILETTGQATEASLSFAGKISKACEVSLLEDDANWGKFTQMPVDLPVQGGVVKVALRPYEFKTLQIRGVLSNITSA